MSTESFISKRDSLNSIFLSPQLLVLLFVTLSLFLTLLYAAFETLIILRRYTPNAATQEQYNLEKKSYLVTTIIQVSLFINIFLLAYFVHTLESLSSIIPGAMCAAGVISANSFGNPLIFLKVIIIILSLIWIHINKEDFVAKGHPYFKAKLLFFLFIFTLLSIDSLLEINFFTHLSTIEPVMCCSRIYKSVNAVPFLNTALLPTLFYFIFTLLTILLYYKKNILSAAFSLLFLYISYLSITYFFSTYIYELPTHKCPYCLLGADYYYIGYFIYASLILATYNTLIFAIFPKKEELRIKALRWYLFLVALLSYKFILYLLVNHTTL